MKGRGGMGGGAFREKMEVRWGKGGGRAGREKSRGRDGIRGEGAAGIQNTCGRGGNNGVWTGWQAGGWVGCKTGRGVAASMDTGGADGGAGDHSM